MLCINHAFAMGLLIAFRKPTGAIDLKKEGWVVFGIPAALHVFDLVYSLTAGNTGALVPVIGAGLIHIACQGMVFTLGRNPRQVVQAA